MRFAAACIWLLYCCLPRTRGAETQPADYDSVLDLVIAAPCITANLWAECNFGDDGAAFGSLRALGATSNVVLESSNWASAEIVANVAHLLMDEALGIEVKRVVQSDYLGPYARVDEGNTTMMFETWDLQMTEAWQNLPSTHSVEKRALGMVGLESLWMPSYALANPDFSSQRYTDLKELDAYHAFIRVPNLTSTSCHDHLTHPPGCFPEDFDCLTETYTGPTGQQGNCASENYDYVCTRFGSAWESTECDRGRWCTDVCRERPWLCWDVMMYTPGWAPGKSSH